MKFSTDKLKVQLKIVKPRIELVHKKKISLNIRSKNEIADLLEKGKINTARIKVENIIREDFNIESLEILALCCELLNTRLLLLNEKEVNDLALLSAIKTIIFSAPRCEIKEMTKISKILEAKFGSKFIKAALNNTDQDINQKIYKNYMIKSLDENLVNRYLQEIANSYKIECELTQKANDIRLSCDNNNRNNNNNNNNDNNNDNNNNNNDNNNKNVKKFQSFNKNNNINTNMNYNPNPNMNNINKLNIMNNMNCMDNMNNTNIKNNYENRNFKQNKNSNLNDINNNPSMIDNSINKNNMQNNVHNYPHILYMNDTNNMNNNNNINNKNIGINNVYNNINGYINNNNNNNNNSISNDDNNSMYHSNLSCSPSMSDSIIITKTNKNIEMNKMDVNDTKDVKKIINNNKIYSLWKKFKGIETDSSDDNTLKRSSKNKKNNL